eukprot:GHVU01001709.1.p1 GENE.GHVU01001709.1~~GHVU01001709.1.p1  ORF type:complete len:167 (-),score=27.19 GHVU01001709.1:969-1430(-)
MEEVFRPLIRKGLLLYIDDLLLYAKTLPLLLKIVKNLITEVETKQHVRRLKFYCEQHRGRLEDIREKAKDAMELYVVEEIREFSYEDGEFMLLIKWKWFPEEHTSWEPAAAIAIDVPDIFINFIITNWDLLPRGLAKIARGLLKDSEITHGVT